MKYKAHINNGGGLPEACRETNNNINKPPVAETDDKHQFVSLWRVPGFMMACFARSKSLGVAAAMIAPVFVGWRDAKHVRTVKVSARLIKKVKSEIQLKKPPFDEKRNTGPYVVLAVHGDGAFELHFLHSLSCAAAWDTVGKGVAKNVVLHAFPLDASLLAKAKFVSDSGVGFISVPWVKSERPI